MKKIIQINLSGRAISIEDTAYEKLQQYIDSLRRYFAKEESRDEIINDIENRIAEMLYDKSKKGTLPVTDEDVEEVAASMGKPEDFEDNDSEFVEEPTAAAGSKKSNFFREPKGRLFRDADDKFLGGVCSGIAAYLNIDPTLVRIIFAIITFGGFGLGIVAYVLMWIIVPEKNVPTYSGKRLFRNPEDQIFAGVCGGLGAYFNKNSNIFRVIFAAPILLSILLNFFNAVTWHSGFGAFPNVVFGSFTGTLVLIYIALWILLPEAKGTYQKMEMRGEKIDVNTISQNVKESVNTMANKFESWGEDVKNSAENFSQKVNEWGKQNEGGRGFLGRTISIIFKAFFIFIAGTIVFGVFVALFALLFSMPVWMPINNYLWTNTTQETLAWLTLIFFIIVPVIAFIVWVIRRITRSKRYSKQMGWGFGILWCIGWICAILLGTSLSKDFRERAFVKTEIAADNKPNQLKVVVSQPELQYNGNYSWVVDVDDTGWDINDETMKLSAIRFVINESDDSAYHMNIYKSGFGQSNAIANTRASNILYGATYENGVLDLESFFTIFREDKYRAQLIEVEILVPKGKQIVIDESVYEKLDASFSYQRWGKKIRKYRGHYDYTLRKNTPYYFNESGRLVRVGQEEEEKKQREAEEKQRFEEEKSRQYETEEVKALERRKKEIQDSMDVEIEKRRIREEAERRIQELEKNKDRSQSAKQVESMDELATTKSNYGFFASPLSIFSLF